MAWILELRPSDAASILPVSTLAEERETNYLNYVYRRSTDAASAGLTYDVVAGTDLVMGKMRNTTEEDGSSGDLGNGYQSVTNRVPVDTEAKQFMKLKVER